jgi:membrane protein YdbS with pleckstrin-like domain
MDGATTCLDQVELFSRLSHEELADVAALAEPVDCPAGTVLCRQGEANATWYALCAGEVQLRRLGGDGVERVVRAVAPGESFGAAVLLLGEPQSATAVALEDTALLAIAKAGFDDLRTRRPRMVQRLVLTPGLRRRLNAPRFGWQGQGEVTIYAARRHVWPLIRMLLRVVALLIVLMPVIAWVWARNLQPWAVTIGAQTLVSLLALWFFIDWLNDRYIVTNKRVAFEERVMFVFETRTEAPLRMVQNVEVHKNGLLARLLDFGDVVTATAGRTGEVVFQEVGHPDQVAQAVWHAVEQERAQAKADARAAIRETMRERLHPASGESEHAPPQRARRLQRHGPLWALYVPASRFFDHFVPRVRVEQEDTVTWRKHPLVLVRETWRPGLALALATALLFLRAYEVIHLDWPPPDVWVAAYGVIAVVCAGWLLWKYEDWRNDVYQVTAQRVIDVKRQPFLLREDRREAPLETVQNITYHIPGILARVLNTGTVVVQTAARSGDLEFHWVYDPAGVQREIFERMERFQQRKREDEARQRQTELSDWFAVYHEVAE